MSYVSPERSVSVDSYTHNGNLFDPTKQYVCIRVWLPEGAPMKFLAESWNECKEPDIENRPPSVWLPASVRTTIRCHGCQACQLEPDLSYGSFLGGDPRKFSPDPECSTEAERALHKQHCQEWDKGQQPAVLVSGLEPLPEHKTKDGRTIPAGAIAFVERAVYGLGVNVVEWPKPICGGNGRIELWPGANGRRAWRNWLRSQRKHDKGSWAASLGVVRGRAAFARRHRGSSAGQGIPEVPGMPPVRRV